MKKIKKVFKINIIKYIEAYKKLWRSFDVRQKASPRVCAPFGSNKKNRPQRAGLNQFSKIQALLGLIPEYQVTCNITGDVRIQCKGSH
jgi:hypothetical protein